MNELKTLAWLLIQFNENFQYLEYIIKCLKIAMMGTCIIFDAMILSKDFFQISTSGGL